VIDCSGIILVKSFIFITIFCSSIYSFSDTESSRKLREEFAKTCFETLLQFSFISKSQSEEGSITKVAVLSLLQRCQDVVKKYVEDERLSGKCPLPRYPINIYNGILHFTKIVNKKHKKLMFYSHFCVFAE
jgi:hypothetical protein